MNDEFQKYSMAKEISNVKLFLFPREDVNLPSFKIDAH